MRIRARRERIGCPFHQSCSELSAGQRIEGKGDDEARKVRGEEGEEEEERKGG